MRFRNRLALFFVVTLAVVQSVAAIVLYDITRDLIIKKSERDLRTASRVLTWELENVSHHAKAALALVTADNVLHKAIVDRDWEAARAVLRGHVRNTGASRIVFMDPRGMVLASSDPSVGATPVAFPFPSLIRTASKGTGTATAVIAGGVDLVAVAPVEGPGRVGYVALCAPVEAATLKNLGARSPIPIAVSLLRPEASGQWTVAVPSERRALGMTFAASTDLPGEGEIATISNGLGSLVTLTQPLAMAAESAPVLAVFDVPRNEVMRPLWRYSKIMLTVFLVSTAAALGGSVVISHTVSRPLDMLAETAGRIASGDYTPPPKLAAAREIKQLSEALTVMADAIKQREEALTDAMASIQTAHDEAVQSNIAKSQFLSFMSHELRTPLNAVIGFGEIIEHQAASAKGDETLREYAHLIVDSGRNLLTLLDEMMDIPRLEAGRLRLHCDDTDFPHLLMKVAQSHQENVGGPEIRVTFDPPQHDWPLVDCDARKIKRVFKALIGNAVKFTPKDGTVHVSCTWSDDRLYVSIDDTGIGIEPHEIPHVFKPFYRANRTYDAKHQGIGIGLGIAKAIVELHGGSLTLTSTLGQGTKVTLTLPRSATAPVQRPKVVS